MKLGELRPAAEKVARKRVGRGIGSGTGKTGNKALHSCAVCIFPVFTSQTGKYIDRSFGTAGITEYFGIGNSFCDRKYYIVQFG